MSDVLVVESNDDTCREVEACLESVAGSVYRAGSITEGLRMVKEVEPDLVLASDRLPDGGSGLLLDAANRAVPAVPVVLLCERITSRSVFSGSAAGAYDFLAMPVARSDVRRILTRLETDRRSARRRPRPLVTDAEAGDDEAVGSCPAILASFRTAGAAAGTDATVLVRGETGTGKELMARAIHRASGRSGPFVAVNCAAIVESLAESELYGHERGAFTGASERRPGCFERADQGTLFLDEIGEASAGFQAKLLRALDRGEFYRVGGSHLVRPDVRIVAATNRDLEAAVVEETFRGDLFYRLAEVSIHLPPLRERCEDIPRIAGHLIPRISRRINRRVIGISEDALTRLMAYAWPGNIRELQNVLTRASLSCPGGTLEVRHFVDLGRRSTDPLPEIPTLEALEKAHIQRVLEATAWNRGRTCEILGIARPTLRRKIRTYGLAPPSPAQGVPFILDTQQGAGHDSAGRGEDAPVT